MAKLNQFIAIASGIENKSKTELTEAYHALRSEYGVLRTSEGFWQRSDRLQDEHRRKDPAQFGLLDYNRLEAF